MEIRPSGTLNGVAKNDPDSKAILMPCVMLKCLHARPSVMVAPDNKLNGQYQFNVVISRLFTCWIIIHTADIFCMACQSTKMSPQECDHRKIIESGFLIENQLLLFQM